MRTIEVIHEGSGKVFFAGVMTLSERRKLRQRLIEIAQGGTAGDAENMQDDVLKTYAIQGNGEPLTDIEVVGMDADVADWLSEQVLSINGVIAGLGDAKKK